MSNPTDSRREASGMGRPPVYPVEPADIAGHYEHTTVRPVVKSGNSGAVSVPGSWLGHQCIVIRVDEE